GCMIRTERLRTFDAEDSAKLYAGAVYPALDCADCTMSNLGSFLVGHPGSRQPELAPLVDRGRIPNALRRSSISTCPCWAGGSDSPSAALPSLSSTSRRSLGSPEKRFRLGYGHFGRTDRYICAFYTSAHTYNAHD